MTDKTFQHEFKLTQNDGDKVGKLTELLSSCVKVGAITSFDVAWDKDHPTLKFHYCADPTSNAYQDVYPQLVVALDELSPAIVPPTVSPPKSEPLIVPLELQEYKAPCTLIKAGGEVLGTIRQCTVKEKSRASDYYYGSPRRDRITVHATDIKLSPYMLRFAFSGDFWPQNQHSPCDLEYYGMDGRLNAVMHNVLLMSSTGNQRNYYGLSVFIGAAEFVAEGIYWR